MPGQARKGLPIMTSTELRLAGNGDDDSELIARRENAGALTLDVRTGVEWTGITLPPDQLRELILFASGVDRTPSPDPQVAYRYWTGFSWDHFR